MPVEFEELEGSPIEQVNLTDGFSASRNLVCDWEDRYDLVVELMGQVTQVSATEFIVQPPTPYPGTTHLFPSSFAIRPFDTKPMAHLNDKSRATYKKAQITVAYAPRQLDDQGQEILVTESLVPAAEFLTLPPSGLHWASPTGPPLKEEEAPGKLLVMLEWEYTRHRLQFINPAILALVGHVNQAPVQSRTLGLVFPEETLLYNPPRLSRAIDINGNFTWDQRMSFSFKPQGWNKFWRTSAMQWQEIYGQGGVVKPYPLGDFLQLTG